ncbi:hypothetical protein JG687_00013289 [Phytophthora cactorum]|uniref:Uncharacterized protein n=1 Tax=Phytophthora cactorum TaxID=29920 RepID=A0A8T1TZD7_9STRA|nr:hypothetical protein JG687_00013289 [Phytophthora cactorum]
MSVAHVQSANSLGIPQTAPSRANTQAELLATCKDPHHLHLSVIIAATLHVSNSTLLVTESNQTTIVNVVSTDISSATEAGNGRLLRRVEEDAAFENDTNEERVPPEIREVPENISLQIEEGGHKTTE